MTRYTIKNKKIKSTKKSKIGGTSQLQNLQSQNSQSQNSKTNLSSNVIKTNDIYKPTTEEEIKNLIELLSPEAQKKIKDTREYYDKLETQGLPFRPPTPPKPKRV